MGYSLGLLSGPHDPSTQRVAVAPLPSPRTPTRRSRRSNKAITPAVGASSRSMVTPGMLLPGRLRLWTRPIWTGSIPVTKTIGIVVVAAFAASAEAEPPTVTITEGLRLTSSVASAGNSIVLTPAPSILDCYVLTLGVAGLLQTLVECCQGAWIGFGGCRA